MSNVDSERESTNATEKFPGEKSPTNYRNAEKSDELDEEYQFYRSLVKMNIFKMTNSKEQRVISSWLYRCDEEENKSLKCGIVKLLLVSVQNPGGNLKYFRHTAPKHLPYVLNNPNMLNDLVETALNGSDSSEDEADARRQTGDGRHRGVGDVAVSSDMTSVATAFADNSCVQVFYARSDRTIDTWRLPDHVQLPVDSRSPSQWERALLRSSASAPDTRFIQ